MPIFIVTMGFRNIRRFPLSILNIHGLNQRKIDSQYIPRRFKEITKTDIKKTSKYHNYKIDYREYP